ncbi:MAG: hypothetical protein GX937_05940 [Lentisphaerae bacterium]|jgi:hypothetical protein|nr:hypothetical protein [Lentisphaerota bacterium]
MKKTMSLLMVMALTMAAGLAWSQAEATMTCRKAACAMTAGKDVCKAECPYKAEGKCAMGEARGACKMECTRRAEGKCAMGEAKGACKAECPYKAEGRGGMGKGAGMKAYRKTGCCAAQKAACPKANATEKAE